MFLSQIIVASPPYQACAQWARSPSLAKNIIRAVVVTAAVALLAVAILIFKLINKLS